MFFEYILIRVTFYLALSFIPGTVKSNLYALSNLIATIIILILQMRHLKLREVKKSTETQLQVEKWRFKLGVSTHTPKSITQ